MRIRIGATLFLLHAEDGIHPQRLRPAAHSLLKTRARIWLSSQTLSSNLLKHKSPLNRLDLVAFAAPRIVIAWDCLWGRVGEIERLDGVIHGRKCLTFSVFGRN